MPRIPASQARMDFSETLNRVHYTKERVVLHRHGKDLAAVVPMEDLKKLEDLEDLRDARDLKRSLARNKGKKLIPLAEARKRLAR